MNQIARLSQDIQALKHRVLVEMTGEEDNDSEHLQACADLLQEAMEEREGVQTR